jgi:hypothetical protein
MIERDIESEREQEQYARMRSRSLLWWTELSAGEQRDLLIDWAQREVTADAEGVPYIDRFYDWMQAFYETNVA